MGSEARNVFGPPMVTEPTTDHDPRCPGCAAEGRGRLLARLVTRPWIIECPRCNSTVYGSESGIEWQKRSQRPTEARRATGAPSKPLRRS